MLGVIHVSEKGSQNLSEAPTSLLNSQHLVAFTSIVYVCFWSRATVKFMLLLQVRQLDLVSRAWPKELTRSSPQTFPASVRGFLTMSTAGSTTDFHPEIGGASTWFHVVDGNIVSTFQVFWKSSNLAQSCHSDETTLKISLHCTLIDRSIDVRRVLFPRILKPHMTTSNHDYRSTGDTHRL